MFFSGNLFLAIEMTSGARLRCKEGGKQTTIVLMVSVVTFHCTRMFRNVAGCMDVFNTYMHLLSLQKSDFRAFSAVFPMGIAPDPDMYRVVVGLVQLAYAILLCCCRGDVHHAVSLISVVHILGALYTHNAVGHPYYKMVEAIVCLVLSVGRFFV